jgi:mannose-6-phosphate isomerase-like protein (cupin superfamily)
MKKALLGALAIVLIVSSPVAFTQTSKAKPSTATYITKEEVDIVDKQAPGVDNNPNIKDRTVKVVDIGHENFAVGIIHRDKTVNGVVVTGGTAGNASPASGPRAAAPERCGQQMATAPTGGTVGGITHDFQTEGYYIVSGGGTMFTDGYIVNGRHSVPDVNGPTCGGVAYGVTKKVVKPGDIIVIPPGVVHGWLDIPDHVDYLSFRPSPGILTAGWVNPVLKKQ